MTPHDRRVIGPFTLTLLVNLALTCVPSTEPCDGRCGPGTLCQREQCMVAPPPAEPNQPQPNADPTPKRRRRGARKGSPNATPTTAGLDDQDNHIPRYRPGRDEVVGEGSERLGDHKVRQQLATLEPGFNRCLRRAAEVSDAELAGTVSFELGIEPSGKVWGVNAALPASWSVPGLRACFRRVVYEHRFPSWNGPAMEVDYHFKVD